jgi:hypothetical protein
VGFLKKSVDASRSEKSYKKALVITGVVVIAVIGIIFGSYASSANPQFSSWLNVKIFSLDKSSYAIGDKVTMTSTRLSNQHRGEVIFTQPNGKIHHTYPFDGSRVNTIEHSFRIMSPSDDCKPTDMLGTWQVSFRMPLGLEHDTISFEVVSDTEYSKDLEPCSKK